MLDLGRTLIAAVEREPDALALVDGDVRLGYGAWFDRIRRVAGGLSGLGIKRGERLVVVLQNTAAVKTQILFFSFEMSQSVLLICTALLGFAIGVLTALLGVKKRRGPAQPELRA